MSDLLLYSNQLFVIPNNGLFTKASTYLIEVQGSSEPMSSHSLPITHAMTLGMMQQVLTIFSKHTI